VVQRCESPSPPKRSQSSDRRPLSATFSTENASDGSLKLLKVRFFIIGPSADSTDGTRGFHGGSPKDVAGQSDHRLRLFDGRDLVLSEVAVPTMASLDSRSPAGSRSNAHTPEFRTVMSNGSARMCGQVSSGRKHTGAAGQT